VAGDTSFVLNQPASFMHCSIGNSNLQCPPLTLLLTLGSPLLLPLLIRRFLVVLVVKTNAMMVHLLLQMMMMQKEE
jgi:hypothetical protein